MDIRYIICCFFKKDQIPKNDCCSILY